MPTKDVFLHIGSYKTGFSNIVMSQDNDWHVGNQLDYKEQIEDEFIAPPNFTVFQNMKQFHKKKQHVKRSIYNILHI